MKRLYFGLLLALSLVASQSFAKGFGDKFYFLEVHDERSYGQSTAGLIEDASVLVFVYDAGTKTLSTIYSDTSRTAKTNPISRSQFNTDNAVKFYGASSTYDIVLAHSDGSFAKYGSVGFRSHRLQLNRNGSHKVMVFPIAASAGGSETDTGLDLPYGSSVYDAAVEIVTVDATETVDVGLLSTETAGDADGFLDGVPTGTAGLVAPFTYSVGSNETYLDTSFFYYGVLLAAKSVGNDTATDTGSFGRLKHYVTGSNATSISYTPSTSDTMAGYGYVYFQVLR